jgi:DNA-binding NarL/FixJ family response regulator
MEKVTIAIADDHKLFRRGIISILNEYPEVGDVLEFENGKELLEKLKVYVPQVILLDLNMPVMNGWEVMAEIRKMGVQVRIIVLSMYEEENFIVNAIKNGAGAFLSKNAEPEEIILAVQSVMQTGYYFNDSTNKALLKKMLAQDSINPLFPTSPIELTGREQQVLQLISNQLSNTEIAEKLFLGIRTVESVRQKLMEKFGAKNSVGLVLNAAKRGYIQL